jgi:predicted MPP superfamily phosphohydrolase
VNRRKFLTRVAAGVGGTVGFGAAAWAYGRFEATWLHVVRVTVAVPRLPPPFAGLRVALVTDPHLGPFNSLEYIRSAVDAANALAPDLIAVGGDHVHGPRARDFIHPCLRELGRLRAPLGVYAVPGNHDHWADIDATHRAVCDAGLTDVTNAGVWVEWAGERLRVAGVDDLMWGKPQLAPALGDAGPDDCCLLLSHNPEVAETLTDRRVGLVLSGHMHGGQVVIPGVGYHRLPAMYGAKYVAGLVQGPCAAVFVSRGVGTIGLPVRVLCRPEINLLTLVPAPSGGSRRGQ